LEMITVSSKNETWPSSLELAHTPLICQTCYYNRFVSF
jgi:hypothetical protein